MADSSEARSDRLPDGGSRTPPDEPYEALAQHGPGAWLRRTVGGTAEDGNVLVVGCKRGRALGWLTDHDGVRSVTGIDPSAEQVIQVSEHDGAAVSVADPDSLPFPEDCFDIVVCSGTLPRLPGWSERALPEFARVLGPEGALILTEGLMVWDPLLWVYRAVGAGDGRRDGKRPLPPRKLERRLGELFETIEVNGHYYLAPMFPALDAHTPLPVPEWLTTAWYDVEYRLCNPWLRHFGGRINAVAENPA